jgi:hypothetical protein
MLPDYWRVHARALNAIMAEHSLCRPGTQRRFLADLRQLVISELQTLPP